MPFSTSLRPLLLEPLSRSLLRVVAVGTAVPFLLAATAVPHARLMASGPIPSSRPVQAALSSGPQPIVRTPVRRVTAPQLPFGQRLSHQATGSLVATRYGVKPLSVDPSGFMVKTARHDSGHGLAGIGFPAISEALSDRWSPMLEWRETPRGKSRQPIAAVRCMGLSSQTVAARADDYELEILKLAFEHKISASLLKAVATQESCFNHHARSTVGAIGLMQLMPETAAWLRVRDPHDPLQNLEGGARYLASLIDEFGGIELALAAYNAGPGTVRRRGGVPPYPETQTYIQRVMANYRRYVVATRMHAHGRPDIATYKPHASAM